MNITDSGRFADICQLAYELFKRGLAKTPEEAFRMSEEWWYERDLRYDRVVKE